MKPQPIRIDVGAVLRGKLGEQRFRKIPRLAIRALEKLICQDSLNRLLEDTAGLTDAPFCREVLRHLDVSVKPHATDNIPADPGRALFVSNHPLGGLDGMALIYLISSHYGGSPVRFVVNDLLSAVVPLRGSFLPVNKHGAQSRDAARAIDEAFASNLPVIMFPAGLVSRKKNLFAAPRDLAWNKMFVRRALDSGRQIIPLHFSGRNSNLFYNFALLRSLAGIKFNIEMVLLPSEMFRSRGKRFDVTFGTPVSPDILALPPRQAAAMVRESVYNLNPPR